MDSDEALNIIVIDDDARFRGVIINMLETTFPRATVVEASDGTDGLEALRAGDFDCVILDYKMPQKDGMAVLKEARAAGIEIPIIITTGFGEEHLAVELMKAGASDYLPKTECTVESISRVVRSTIALYKSEKKGLAAEKELLEKTLIGAVSALIDILGLVNPLALTRAARIKRYVHHITSQLHLPDAWQFELAAILSQIGYVLIPPDILKKVYQNTPLSEHEDKMLQAPPGIASSLISKIPRLEAIAQIIEAQQQPSRRHTSGGSIRAEDSVMLGGHILNLAIEFDRLVEQGLQLESILEQLRQPAFTYDPELLGALESIWIGATSGQVKSIGVQELKVGMELHADVFSNDSLLLASTGQEVTFPMLRRLHTFADGVGVVEPILINASSATT